MHENKEKSITNEMELGDTQKTVESDLSDVGLCSLNVHEYSFNVLLCYLQLKQYDEALSKCSFLISTVPEEYANSLWIIRAVIYETVGDTASSFILFYFSFR